jgi:glycosyltransferase involved in cell wall biosynthesis
MKISILLPTRKRAANIVRLFNSILRTAIDFDKLEISLRLDEDDTITPAIINLYKDSKLNFRTIKGPCPDNNGDLWNDAWKNATGELYMMCGDDFVFRTEGWDLAIRAEFEKVPDRILFVFGRDGIQEGFIGTHGVIHKNWTDCLGYYAPMQFAAYCHDTWLSDIAKKLKRFIYLPHLYFEHMHYCNKKAEIDENYTRMNDKYLADLELWRNLERVRIEEANKLRKVMK